MIEKIKYTIFMYDIETMTIGRREIYEIFPDGRVSYHGYETGSRKCLEKSVSASATGADFCLLCEKLEDCISSADRENQYLDDTFAELKLDCSFNRTETLPRGYGNARTDVGQILCEYLRNTAHALR